VSRTASLIWDTSCRNSVSCQRRSHLFWRLT